MSKEDLTKVISTGYKPRHHQQILHASMKRFNVLVCHRRFGKTVFSINELIDKAGRCKKKNPQYAYVAPNYGQAKRVAWDYVKEYTKDYPGRTVNEAELRIDMPIEGGRIRIMLLGAENPASIRGIYLDGVILDEYAEMEPTAWTQVLRPALSDRMGWAIFIGTPKGMNHFYDIYKQAEMNPDWYTAIFQASKTKIIAKSELESAGQNMSEEEYNQEWECSFSAAIVGAYFGKQIEEAERDGRITKVLYDKAVLVDTWWDLGIRDATSIWFTQTVYGKFHIINYIEDSGRDLAHYAKLVNQLPYTYGEHQLPHDVAQPGTCQRDDPGRIHSKI